MEIQQEVKINIKPCADWVRECADWLRLAVASDADAENLRLQFENGAALFSVEIAGACCGAFLLRVDREYDGDSGVVVAAGGHYPGINLILSIIPAIEKIFIGCAKMRIHSDRPGMARQLAKLGYPVKEIVYEKGITA